MKRTFSERKFGQSDRRLKALLSVYLITFFCSTSYVYFHWKTIKIPDVLGFTVGITFLAMFIILLRELFSHADQYEEKLYKEMDNSKKGIEGEALAREAIAKVVSLDDKVFFNKELPSGGDIDCIIIGQKGFILIEIKNFSKRLYLPLIRVKGFYDPRDEARRHGRKLREYLEQNGYSKTVPMHLAVLYVNPDVVFRGKQNGVYNICGLEKLKEYLENLPVEAVPVEDFQQMNRLIEAMK